MEKRVKSSEREAFRLIEEMLQLMEARGLVELEMEHQGLRIRLKKASSSPTPQVVEYVTGIPQPVPAAAAGQKIDEESHRIVIKSPMVGTFYRAPEPGAAPFVEAGDSVSKGQTVAVIEAMKTFNEIPSPRDGVVKQILVESGAPVEYGEALMVVE